MPGGTFGGTLGSRPMRRARTKAGSEFPSSRWSLSRCAGVSLAYGALKEVFQNGRAASVSLSGRGRRIIPTKYRLFYVLERKFQPVTDLLRLHCEMPEIVSSNPQGAPPKCPAQFRFPPTDALFQPFRRLPGIHAMAMQKFHKRVGQASLHMEAWRGLLRGGGKKNDGLRLHKRKSQQLVF